MVSLSSGLLQIVSSANLLTPDSTGSSAIVDQNHIQLGELVDQQQGISSVSAQSADDTYTPSSQSAQSSAGQSAQTSPPGQVPSNTPGISATDWAMWTAQFAGDTYTPSNQSAQSSVGQSAQTSPPGQVPWNTPGISATEAWAMWTAGGPSGDTVEVSWGNLKEDIAAGDLSSAQTDLTAYQQALVNTNANMSVLTAPSAQFESDLTALGSALQEGDVSSAQSAFAVAKQDAPQNIGDAYSSSLGALELDGEGTAIRTGC